MFGISTRLARRFGYHYFVEPAPTHSLPFAIERLPVGRMASFGSRNPGRVFYVIWRECFGSGFFSNLSQVLCHLMIADSVEAEPVIDFENFPTLYNEDKEVRGTRNAWEYYFRQTSLVPLNEIYDSRHVFLCDGKYPATFSYNVTSIPGSVEVFNKHVQVLPEIEESVRTWIKEFGTRTLGIHFRGQEQNRTPGHAFGPTKRQMLEASRTLARELNLDRIFLVTEDQSYLDLLRSEFGSALIFTNSFRTRGKNAYRMQPRSLHRYKLGREVLVDAILLSRCQALICSDSNVSEFAKLMNGGRYEAIWQIWNGLNCSNPLAALYVYNIRRHLPARFGGLPGTIRSQAQ